MQPSMNTKQTLEDLIKSRLHEMQYEAMAHALSGQTVGAEFEAEYVRLEKILAEAAKSQLERIRNRMQEMQYTAMAHALSGQELPSNFAKEFAEFETQLQLAENNI